MTTATQTNSIPFNALRGVYGPSARNFVWSVAARQTAFCLQSRGFSPDKAQPSNVKAAPWSDEACAFDAALSVGLPTVDMARDTTVTFNRSAACEAYAVECVMISDLLNSELEYGRKPKPESLSRYLSNPQQWLAEKIAYHAPRLTKTAAEQGATFGATAEAITKAGNAKVAEYTAFAHARAVDLAQTIKGAIARHNGQDFEELVSDLEESLNTVGINLAEETIGAAKAMLKSRREAFTRGEKVTMPQPGILKLFADLGVTA